MPYYLKIKYMGKVPLTHCTYEMNTPKPWHTLIYALLSRVTCYWLPVGSAFWHLEHVFVPILICTVLLYLFVFEGKYFMWAAHLPQKTTFIPFTQILSLEVQLSSIRCRSSKLDLTKIENVCTRCHLCWETDTYELLKTWSL